MTAPPKFGDYLMVAFLIMLALCIIMQCACNITEDVQPFPCTIENIEPGIYRVYIKELIEVRYINPFDVSETTLSFECYDAEKGMWWDTIGRGMLCAGYECIEVG